MKPGSEEWFRERADKIIEEAMECGMESALRRVWNAACEEEREACAKLCENYSTLIIPFMLKAVAAAIRDRTKKVST